jgi:cytochrome P450
MSRTNHHSLTTRLKRELPPCGPIPATMQTLGCRWWPYVYMTRCRERFGSRFTVYPLSMPPLVFLADPQEIREVLTAPATELHPGAGSKILAPLIGARSFMLLEEDEHTHRRQTITPAFHKRMVTEQTSALAGTVEREVASWPTDRPVALHPRIRALTLRVILRVIFSTEDEHTLDVLHAHLMRTFSVTTSFILQEPSLRFGPGWHRTWTTFLKQRSDADALIYGIFERRRSKNRSEPQDLLDMLLSAENTDGSPMPDVEIRNDVMSMILAGHETTTGELSWAFQLMAHNQTTQERLIDEIDRGGGEEYLTATVYETLRHKPVFLFAIPREVIRPIEIGGRTYPPGVHLAACTYLMHHSHELYRRPDEFRPERFIEEPPTTRTWMPWGGGRKHCLGRHFALLEVQAILREVLAGRRVHPTSHRIERPRWRSAILVPHRGGRVLLSRR